MNWDDDFDIAEDEERPPDPVEEQAIARLRVYFERNAERIVFSRQVELLYEDEFFHWITNRALRRLIEEGYLASEIHKLEFGGAIKLIWRKSFRYYKRSAGEVVRLVSEYSMPAISEALGDQGEVMVLAALAVNGFKPVGRHANRYREKAWLETQHNLDIIVERDGIGYGVEVKNTLPYISQKDLRAKRAVCDHLGLRPLFAVRMMPKTWINEVRAGGGYSLILKYQLYPWSQRELARRVESQLGLPVRCAKEVEQGLMERLVQWHGKNP
jgi:hypothetical protein